MKRTNHGLNVLGLIALMAFAQSAWARTCTAQAGGPYSWNQTSTWSGCNGNTPRDGDTVIIPNGSTVTLNVDTNQLVSLTVQAGGVLQGINGGQNLVDLSGGPGNLTNNGTITLTDNVLNLAGNFINNGNFTAGTSVTTFLGATPTIGGTSPTTFANLDLSQTTSVLLGNNVTVTGALTGTINLASTCPTDYTLTSNNGATVQHSCPASAAPPSLAYYHMDEASWNGTANQVVDSSGNGNNAQSFNSASTDGTTSAIPGSPGTCRYGVFDNTSTGGTINQGYVQTPLPDLTTNFTVTAWIRTNNAAASGQRILIDDQNNTGGYGISLGDGGTGRIRFYSRAINPVIFDSTYTVANNTWYFVAAVADTTNRKRSIYVFSQTGALLNASVEGAAYSGSWGTDAGPVSIGGETNASGEPPANFHFRGNLDEVQVFQTALTQTQLGTIAVQTHPCGGGVTGCIPTTINGVQTPVMGGLGKVQIGGGVTVNSTAVTNNGNANSIAVTGVTTGVTPSLPALVPSNFPTSASSTNTSATTIAAGSYNSITTGTAQTTFTGGTYYINNLTAIGPIALGAGTYYINNLSLNSSTADITVTGAVQIFIGNNFQVNANNVSVNAGGSVANLQVNFYPGAQLDTQNSSNFSFTGLMYAPDATTQIQIQGAGSTITGVVISGGQVQLNNTAIIYGATQQNQVATMTTTCSGGGGIGATAGSFNAFESSTAANSTTGLLYTKLAGTPFTFDVVAIQTNGTAIANTFAGTVKVELVDFSTGAACATAPLIQSVGTLTFATSNAGRMTAPQTTVVAAWSNARVRMTTPATGTATAVACSTDSFSVRPLSVTSVVSSNATNTGTGGTPIFKAGSDLFILTATTGASGTLGYTGQLTINAAASSVQASSPATVAGVLSGSFPAAVAGVATGNSFTYGEVGAFNLLGPDFTLTPTRIPGVYDNTWTAVDSGANNDCVSGTTAAAYSNIKNASGKYGCNFGITANTGAFGRFVPDHFNTAVVATPTTPMPCPTGLSCPALYNGFVYSGQPFTVQVTAWNAAGLATQNYASALSKTTTLTAWNLPGGPTANPGGGTMPPPPNTVPSTAFTLGVATTNTPFYTYPAPPALPQNIYVRATDSDNAANPTCCTSLRTSGSVEGGLKVVSGRIKMANANGSELLPLTINMTAQYWAASGWVTSTTDSATNFVVATPPAGAVSFSNYQKYLTAVSVVGSPRIVTLSVGAGGFNLAAPGAGKNGSVDMTITALTGASCYVAPTPLGCYLPSNAARATFGVYTGANAFIYMRENY